MYNKELVNRILVKLDELFPSSTTSDALKELLGPGFEELPECELHDTIDALLKLGLVSGAELREGSALVNAANLLLTARGREELEREAGSQSSGLNRDSRLVFLSHAATDQEIAIYLKSVIEKVIPNSDVFVSSDTDDLHPGDEWVKKIRENLRAAQVLLLLASERGLSRPWVWYETGAAWSREIPIIPCCLGKVRKNQLAAPFSSYQALNVDEAGDLSDLITEIGRKLTLAVQLPDVGPIVSHLKALERPRHEDELSILTPEGTQKIEQLVVSQDDLQFRVLITRLRDLLVERWHSLNGFDQEAPFKDPAFETKVEGHLRNLFYPALWKLVVAGFLLIKYGLNPDWFERVANLLIEVFGVSGKLAALPPPGARTPVGRPTRGTVGLQVLVGTRVLVTYAIRMSRYDYVPGLLKKYVNPIGSSTARKREPFLFWPLRMNVEGNDRIAYAWQAVVEPLWREFFGSEQSFVEAATQLEFILFLNSYLATKFPVAVQWIGQYRPDTDFAYWYGSDLWRYRLDAVVPLAEKIYENLALGPDAPLLLDFSVEHTVFQKAFSPSTSTTPEQRQEIFVQYLKELLRWQAQAAQSPGGFPHGEPNWGPVLGPVMRGNRHSS
jgi:hypothetical protein